MIVEGIVSVILALVSGLFSVLPGGNPPGWFLGIGDDVSSVLVYAAGMGAWVPLNLAVTVVGAVLACLVAGFAIKITRLVISLFTGGGGSAA